MIVDVKEIQIKGFAVDFHSAEIDDEDGSIQIKLKNYDSGPSDSVCFIAGFGRDVDYFLEAIVITRYEIIKLNISTITFHVDTDSGVVDVSILSTIEKRSAKNSKSKRTKVEYVKVDLSLGDFIEGFRKGLLFYYQGGEYCQIKKENQAMFHARNDSYFVKKETSITERDGFIEAYNEVRDKFLSQHEIENFSNFMYDSGKFKLVEGE